MEKVIVAVVTALFCTIFGSKAQEISNDPEIEKAKTSTLEVQITEIDSSAFNTNSRVRIWN